MAKDAGTTRFDFELSYFSSGGWLQLLLSAPLHKPESKAHRRSDYTFLSQRRHLIWAKAHLD
jgi:hypothetical protein